ncbi:MAG: hypothetical protein Q7S32_03680 [bacterium]|nr:hypothetical protein [bacterium]
MSEVSLYFEAHITIEPVVDERLEVFKTLCRRYDFRVADLLMKKRTDDTPQRSAFDSFCTGRDQECSLLVLRTIQLVEDLRDFGFKVWRYKIESTLMDSEYQDIFSLLS